MSRTIDERIVQMTFDNKDFEKKAGNSLSTLEKLKNALNFDKASSSLKAFQSTAGAFNLNSVTAAAAKVQSSFSAMEIAALTAISNISNRVTNMGLQMVKSLTLDQPISGWNKYVSKTASVQTLVNSTGKSVEEIEGYLSKLMWYSDETSFSFTDMSSALATMISSGGDIDKLIPMIEGIGNAVAYAGKGSAEFSRTIYNLNQSYSQGYLSKLDWKSLDNAGTSSKRLKEVLLDSAESLGLITKNQNKIENFSDLMTDKVFTSAVMEKAFGAFSEYTEAIRKSVEDGTYANATEAMEKMSTEGFTEFSKRAFESAQEAKSFAEAIESTKDAVSTGWMSIFNVIFGNYTEATALWTRLTEMLWQVFASGFKDQIKMLQTWKSLWIGNVYDPVDGVFDEVEQIWKYEAGSLTQVEGVMRALSAVVVNLKKAISEAWNNIFPLNMEERAQHIFDAIELVRNGLWDFYKYISGADTTTTFTDYIIPGFEGLLKVLKLVITGFKDGVSVIKDFFSNSVFSLADKFQKVIGNIGIAFGNIAERIQNSGKIQELFQNLATAISPVVDFIEKLADRVVELSDVLVDMSTNLDLSTLKFGFLQTISNTVKNTFDFLSKVFDGTYNILGKIWELLKKVGEAIKDSFQSISGFFSDFLTTNGANIGGALGGGIFGYFLLNLSSFIDKIKKMKSIDFNFNIPFVSQMENTFKTIGDSISNLFNKTKGKDEQFYTIAKGILILSASLALLSAIKPEALRRGIGGMMMALAELTGAVAILGELKNTSNLGKISRAIASLSIGLIAISLAVKILSSIDPKSMAVAMAGLAGILLALSGFLSVIAIVGQRKVFESGGLKDFKKIGAGMVGLGIGLIAIAGALKLIATMSLPDLGKSLLGLLGLLTIISGFAISISLFSSGGSFALISAGMVLLAPAITVLALALKILSTIELEKIGTSLLALVGILGSIALAAVLISKTGSTLSFAVMAAGLVLISGALAVFTGVLVILSKMNFLSIAKSLTILLASIVGLAVTTTILSGLAPGMIVFSVALAALSASLLLASKAMVAASLASAAIKTFGDNFSYGIGVLITNTIAAIIGAIPAFILGILKAIIDTETQIVAGIVRVIGIVCDAVIESVPKVMDAIIVLIDSVVTKGLNWLSENAEPIVEKLCKIIAGIINGVANGLGDITLALVNLLVSAIESLTEAISNGAPRIGEALGELIITIIKAIPKFLASTGHGMLAALFGDLFDSETEGIGIDQGETIGDNYREGIENSKEEIINTSTEVGEAASEALEDKEGAEESARNTKDGFLNTISNSLSEFYDMGTQAAESYNLGFANALDMHSPSRLMMKNAKFAIQGFVNGVIQNLGLMENSGEESANSFIDALQTSLDLANDQMNDTLNPVITPIVDLSDVESATGEINSLFGRRSLNGAYAITQLQNGANISGIPNNYGVTVNATFNVNNGQTVDTQMLNKWADTLTRRINDNLGRLI